jgi:hypothetical protein
MDHDAAAVLAWAPISGKIHVRLPYRKHNRSWLKRTCGVRAPEFDQDSKHWLISRASLTRVIRASLDAFGSVAFYRDAKALSRCDRRCKLAESFDCACACLGAEHGLNVQNGWVAYGESTLVREDQDKVRIVRLIYPPTVPGEPEIYAGQLDGVLYTADPRRRADWPKAAAFLCAACITSQASVWDHCHAHGYVRAPLCNRCNSWAWSGWSPDQGRTSAETNTDRSYFRRCRMFNRADVLCTG